MSSPEFSTDSLAKEEDILNTLLSRNSKVHKNEHDKHYNTPTSEDALSITSACGFQENGKESEKKIHSYLRGEFTTTGDEYLALDIMKSLSANNEIEQCNCDTCKAYNEENFNYCDPDKFLDLKLKSYERLNKKTEEHGESKYHCYPEKCLKFADCMKICIHSLYLNENGRKRVYGDVFNKIVGPYSLFHTFFVEYHIPDILVKKNLKKSKIDSGLDCGDYIRICSRKLHKEGIHFKHLSIHDIKNLGDDSLHNLEIKFNINFRSPKQKHTTSLGCAVFNMSSFETAKHLTCSREINIMLSDHVPISVGTLKVFMQLGCGRLYFGREFVEAINTSDTNSIALSSDELSTIRSKNDKREVVPEKYLIKKTNTPKSNEVPHSLNTQNDLEEPKKIISSKKFQPPKKEAVHLEIENPPKVILKKNGNDNNSKLTVPVSPRKVTIKTVRSVEVQTETSTKPKIVQTEESSYDIIDCKKPILFGFLYISEAQYLHKPLNTYLVCKPFGEETASYSRLVSNSSSPLFNFCQTTPLIYEDLLLTKLRDNYIVIEIYERYTSRDIIFGITKLPLHQFYIAYRNPVIVKYLTQNKLPIIATDWWEPILSPFNEEVIGQLQVLLALGTETQVTNLELERGFKEYIVKSQFKPSIFNERSFIIEYDERSHQDLAAVNVNRCNSNSTDRSRENKSSNRKIDSDRVYFNDVEFRASTTRSRVSNDTASSRILRKSDTGIQSDITMESKKSLNQDALNVFLNQIIQAQKSKNICVENSTNTEGNISAMSSSTAATQTDLISNDSQLRKTSDLLESLQVALEIDINNPPISSRNSQSGHVSQIQDFGVLQMQDPTSCGLLQIQGRGLIDSQSKSSKCEVFRAHVCIESGLHLPHRKRCKAKKSKNRSSKIESILPSTYVTFETIPGDKANVSKVVWKSNSPLWEYRSDVDLPAELLVNSQKRFILKVWRKTSNASAEPQLQNDVVLGFAALDLTVLLTGLPNIKGWFNIVDFSGKCNGQISVEIKPLENISKYQAKKETYDKTFFEPPAEQHILPSQPSLEMELDNDTDEPGEMLSRALKRKFSELDEITQRLRLRLSKVTNDDSDVSNDDFSEEFERDINTLCIEEDFDTVDFEEEARKFNRNLEQVGLLCADSRYSPKLSNGDSSTESTNLKSFNLDSQSVKSAILADLDCPIEEVVKDIDEDLNRGKKQIDDLLQKLSSLQSCSTIVQQERKIDNLLEKLSIKSDRYVSGCSIDQLDGTNLRIDTEAILEDLDRGSRPNIQSAVSYNSKTFQEIYSEDESNRSLNSVPSTSDTSVITSYSDLRTNPDGGGKL